MNASNPVTKHRASRRWTRTDKRVGRSRRLGAPALPVAVALVGLCCASAVPVEGQGPAALRNPVLGMAHVDVAELHVARRQDGPPAMSEVLSGGDLAARYAHAAALGATWNRWSIYWDLADRGGTFDWAVSDGIVARDAANGLRSLIVLHGNPPGVARVTGAPDDISAPIFLDAAGSPTDDPRRAARVNPGNTFARFVAACVQRYRPGGELASLRGWPAGQGVGAWQIGNEPNSRSFWLGTPAEFARFLEVGYLAVKWVDPAAVVAHGGIANSANAQAWFGAFLDALRARAAASSLPESWRYCYDRTAWHWYSLPSGGHVTAPERIVQMQTERGMPARPLWVTEVGIPVWSEYPGPCWDPQSPGRVTLAEQSACAWQALAEGLAAGAQLLVYFQLYDDCGNGPNSYDALGLVRNPASHQCWAHPGQACWARDPATSGTPRPAYEALRIGARELAGSRFAGVATGSDGYRIATFSRPDGGAVSVAWSTSRRDRTVTATVAGSQATVFELDASGVVRARAVQVRDGRVPLYLPGATNRNGPGGSPLVGGRPVLLVHAGFAERAPGAALGQTTGPVAAPAAAGDTAPPVIALVGTLPESSPPVFELALRAADERSGLARYQVLYTVGGPPAHVGAWRQHLVPLDWPGQPRIGEVRVPFVGAPGQTYYFAAIAADAAGNWTPVPSYAQARTTIASPPGRSPAPVQPIRARDSGTAR